MPDKATPNTLMVLPVPTFLSANVAVRLMVKTSFCTRLSVVVTVATLVPS